MSFTPRTSYGNFGNTQWMAYAVARTGVAMPNCFTYATARISEIVGHNQPLDRYKVSGASQLWNAYASEFTRSSIPVLGALAIFSGGVAPYYYGHVAVVEGISGGKIVFSEASYQEFNFRLNTMSQTPGSYYPNGYNNLKLLGYLVHKELGQEIKLTNENGTYTLTVPTNKRRDSPNGIIAETLPVGKKLTYTNVTTFNNLRYISWVEKEPNGNQYRYFVYAPINESTKSGYNESQLINEVGVATLTQNVNKRRDSPTGIVAETLKVGTKLNYTQKWVGNGHRYISWVETEPNGNKYRYFVAISGSETQGKDLWATFSAPENKNPTTETKAETKAVDTKNVLHWGIDVSEHNDVDVSKYDFVIIRACYGENTDKKFKNYVEQAEHAGIPYGLYLYDYALDDSEAHAETAYLLNLAKSCNPTLGLWIDLETDNYKKKHNSWTKERSSATAEIFLDDLKNSGYYTGIYTSTWFHNNWYPDFKCDFWIANYEEADQGNYHLDTSSMGTINQYTSIDKESGKALDHDAMYVDYDHYKSKIAENEQKSDENVKNNNVLDDDKEMKGLLSTIISLLKKLLSVFGKSGD